MYLKTSVLAAFLSFVAFPVHSFMHTRQSNIIKCQKKGRRSEQALLFLSPEDLTDYMTKAHEEKIRAIKDIEDKKNAEIRTLKSEVDTLKEGKNADTNQGSSNQIVVATTPPASGLEVSNMSKPELAAKVVQYQQFMTKYIVEAQQQKMKAVQAAEAATAARYEGKIVLLKASFTTESIASQEEISVSSSAKTNDTSLYDKRNTNVAAAAKAGKSRWGDKEVAKVKISSNDDINVKSKPVSNNNGTVVNGSTVPSKVSLPGTDLYSKRNAKVAAAAAAGKSRWGTAESNKASKETTSKHTSSSNPTATVTATTSPSAPIVVTPEIEAADHGLRNDGGVGGPSLAERVNLGQQLFNGGNDTTEAASLSSLTSPSSTMVLPSIYDLRNAKIAAAAAAGKSRWGKMENEKATSLASNILPSVSSSSITITPVADIPVPPEVEAADHGLRNDGGVGGPSLAERVNLGSKLF